MVALKFKEYGNTKPGRMGRGVLSQQVERHVLVHHTPVIKWLCVCVCVHMQRCVYVCKTLTFPSREVKERPVSCDINGSNYAKHTTLPVASVRQLLRQNHN